MQSVRLTRLIPTLLVGFVLSLSLGSARTQEDASAPKPVDIVTVDQVELKGHFYPSTQGKNAGTVLLLHALGEDSKKAEWIGLAKALQKAGYAVLRFDFRGHGDSTSVKPGVPHVNPQLRVPGFWDQLDNVQGIRGGAVSGGARKTSIEFKQFVPSYYRVLVNDIAAAKAFLDEKNDAGECNSGNLVLVGAKDGGTLGALWLNSEWHRYRVVPDPKFPMRSRPDLQNPEGQNVTAAVWLSISSTLGDRSVSVPGLLYKAAATNKVPMVFFYAEGDTKGKQAALACKKQLVLDKKNYPYTDAVKVEKGEKFSGVQLLQKGLGVDRDVVTYINGVLGTKTVQAKSRTGKDDISVWQYQLSNGQVRQIMARPPRAPSIVFSNYAPFIR